MIVNTPARMRVMLLALNRSLHVTTVPFNMASGVAVTLRVDVRSVSGGVRMRVAVKLPRYILCPIGLFTIYRIGRLNAALLHSIKTSPVTVHVSVTSSPGQMAP